MSKRTVIVSGGILEKNLYFDPSVRGDRVYYQG